MINGYNRYVTKQLDLSLSIYIYMLINYCMKDMQINDKWVCN